jgi:hypothetical protein
MSYNISLYKSIEIRVMYNKKKNVALLGNKRKLLKHRACDRSVISKINDY